MASIGHVAVGLAAGRWAAPRWGPAGGRRRTMLWAMAALAALSLLPDADAIGFRLGVPYGAEFGHRGASHSLAAALLVGVLCGALARRRWVGALVFLTVASHGVLDAMTDGGKGVALLWPWTLHRYFLPWRPLPVAPLGGRMLTERGLQVMRAELLWFLPCWLYALWPRRRAAGPTPH